jgi:hypothetical protein
MNTFNLLSNFRDALVCLGFLLGVGLGVVLIIRKKTLLGVLALAGFFLLGLSPLLSILYRALFLKIPRGAVDFISWAVPCVSSVAVLLGTIALIIALLKGTKVKKEPIASAEPPDEVK